MPSLTKTKQNNHPKRTTIGFTIIELLIVIAVIGILTTIGIVSFSSIQSSARDTQRSSQITAVSEALEKYFSSNGEYPSCAAMTATPASTVTTNTLKGLDPDTLTTPSAAKGTNSITSCVANPTSDTFSYFGGITDYTLKYKEDSSGNVIPLDGRHHVVTPTYTLTITASTGGTVNTAVNGTYTSSSTPTITASPSTYYSFSSWSGSIGCDVPGQANHTITMDSNKVCTANFTPTAIAAPSAPTVTPSTVGSTTTYSWGAASCPGNTARYQYRYTISPAGYDSGWTATAATSVGFTTTTEGQTYTVAVQAQCYNAATSSPWSASGSGSYLRPITYQTLTLASGGNGSVSGGGSYATGSSPTMTASPNTYYSFSSWTGSTGCSGAASHTITMDANKSCTANFAPAYITPPATPVVSASTSGATTTWSWGAASCPGNSAYYLYRYTNSAGYDSGWPGTSATSVAFTTSTGGVTYTVQVQAECYNAVTSSAWSGAGSAAYYRPLYVVTNEYHLSGGISWNYLGRCANTSTTSMNGWDSNRASCVLPPGGITYIRLGGFTGGSLPSNATVSQIRVRAVIQSPTLTNSFFLLESNGDTQNSYAASNTAVDAFNGVLNLTYNNALPTSTINDWGFEVFVYSDNNSVTISKTVYVDYVDMAIDYTHP